MSVSVILLCSISLLLVSASSPSPSLRGRADGEGDGSRRELLLDDGVALAAPPANDAYSARTRLSGAASHVTGNLAGATVEPNEPKPSPETPDNSESVWYAFTATSTGFLFLDIGSMNGAINNPFNIYGSFDFNATRYGSVALYSDASSVSALVAVPRVASCGRSYDDESFFGAGTLCTVFAVTKSKKYAIQVRAHRGFGNAGAFTLSWIHGGVWRAWIASLMLCVALSCRVVCGAWVQLLYHVVWDAPDARLALLLVARGVCLPTLLCALPNPTNSRCCSSSAAPTPLGVTCLIS
jgi:hypothetical protein